MNSISQGIEQSSRSYFYLPLDDSTADLLRSSNGDVDFGVDVDVDDDDDDEPHA